MYVINSYNHLIGRNADNTTKKNHLSNIHNILFTVELYHILDSCLSS